MATATMPAEQRTLLHNIPWSAYVGFSDGLGERYIRITYDRGKMEIMSVSAEHERDKKLLARLVEALTEELDIDIAGYGSMTFRREILGRALEPDECYWIANEPAVRGRTDIDLDSDPPPDLVLEVEISRSALDRMGLHAAMGVPETWRWDGKALRVELLQSDGSYAEKNQSLAFPFLPLEEMERFLLPSKMMSETKLVRAFRKWVREQIESGWKPATGKKAGKKRRRS